MQCVDPDQQEKESDLMITSLLQWKSKLILAKRSTVIEGLSARQCVGEKRYREALRDQREKKKRLINTESSVKRSNTRQVKDTPSLSPRHDKTQTNIRMTHSRR